MKRTFTDHEILVDLARLMECSEYDIFVEATKLWTISIIDIDRSEGIFTDCRNADDANDFIRRITKAATL